MFVFFVTYNPTSLQGMSSGFTNSAEALNLLQTACPDRVVVQIDQPTFASVHQNITALVWNGTALAPPVGP